MIAGYTPCGAFRRTPAERADQELSWRRPDQAFFAAGACHILAFAALRAYPAAALSIIALRKSGDAHAFHTYASDGTWAFDHDGWTPEKDLIGATVAAEGGWPCERLVIEADLETFCREHNHRPPGMFAHSPWQRASEYVTRFPPPQEVEG